MTQIVRETTLDARTSSGTKERQAHASHRGPGDASRGSFALSAYYKAGGRTVAARGCAPWRLLRRPRLQAQRAHERHASRMLCRAQMFLTEWGRRRIPRCTRPLVPDRAPSSSISIEDAAHNLIEMVVSEFRHRSTPARRRANSSSCEVGFRWTTSGTASRPGLPRERRTSSVFRSPTPGSRPQAISGLATTPSSAAQRSPPERA